MSVRDRPTWGWFETTDWSDRTQRVKKAWETRDYFLTPPYLPIEPLGGLVLKSDLIDITCRKSDRAVSLAKLVPRKKILHEKISPRKWQRTYWNWVTSFSCVTVMRKPIRRKNETWLSKYWSRSIQVSLNAKVSVSSCISILYYRGVGNIRTIGALKVVRIFPTLFEYFQRPSSSNPL